MQSSRVRTLKYRCCAIRLRNSDISKEKWLVFVWDVNPVCVNVAILLEKL